MGEYNQQLKKQYSTAAHLSAQHSISMATAHDVVICEDHISGIDSKSCHPSIPHDKAILTLSSQD